MHSESLRKLSWSGIIAVAAGYGAPVGHTANWCPTPTDYEITCSNCSRELTCDLDGISIKISGSNVTLDGNGHWIWNAPFSGVGVWFGTGTTIRNLNIESPSGDGILFYGSQTSNWSYVDNVYISGSGNHGIQHSGWYPLEIKDSWTYYSLTGVDASYDGYTDFLSSSAQGNDVGYSAHYNSSYVIGNYFWNNSSRGVEVLNVEGTLIDDNSFTSSGAGLVIDAGDFSTITNNYGAFNGSYDCAIYNSTGTYASGNSWTSYLGSGCMF